jgi:hypothetical protein
MNATYMRVMRRWLKTKANLQRKVNEKVMPDCLLNSVSHTS